MKSRKLCPGCHGRPVAINYIRKSKVYYRSLCSHCLRKGKRLKNQPPLWFKSGYRKKDLCEHCKFKAKFPKEQLTVFHVDGDLKNVSWLNLKTVCLNCAVEISRSTLPWRRADLEPDV
jgi:hypothetical protein